MTSIETSSSREVARPLRVLEPLIRSDLENAERAGMPYYRAAGEKLIEARDGNFAGNRTQWLGWATRRFKKSRARIDGYVKLVTRESSTRAQGKQPKDYTSMRQFQREELGYKPSPVRVPRTDWHADVQKNIDAARARAQRLQDEELSRQQERKAERELALKLIDIGYKVLARELHPDKGGSRDAMSRLNRVRKHLQHFA